MKGADSINIDTITNRKQSGLYIVPGDLIVQPKHYLPAVYVACMRYANLREEVVTSVKFIIEYLCLKPSSKPNSTNQRAREALHTMRRLKIIKDTSFPGKDKQTPTVNEAFSCKFNRGYGWYPTKHLTAGYVKETELELMRKTATSKSFGMIESFPVMLHTLLYCRMLMEKPGTCKTFIQAEKRSIAIVLERDLVEAFQSTPATVFNALKVLQRRKLIDYRRRVVRERRGSIPQKIYVIVNHFNGNLKLLQKGVDSLSEIFASCEFIPEKELRESQEVNLMGIEPAVELEKLERGV